MREEGFELGRASCATTIIMNLSLIILKILSSKTQKFRHDLIPTWFKIRRHNDVIIPYLIVSPAIERLLINKWHPIHSINLRVMVRDYSILRHFLELCSGYLNRNYITFINVWMEQLRNISSILSHTNQKATRFHTVIIRTLHFSLLSMHGLVMVINHSVFISGPSSLEQPPKKHQGGTHS